MSSSSNDRTYTEALSRLYRRRWFGVKLGLENIRRLCRLLGNPEKRLRFIHVAGTNGKGSTCAMLESVYRHAGYRVGLFLSPHLASFRERIQINRYPIPTKFVVDYVERIESVLRHEDFEPTFFEVVTAMALLYFAEQGVDLVVWETGMGGRLDATNVVEPLVSVITNVQFDHLQWLGSTLREIAYEKAGIIKPGRPAVVGSIDPEVLDTISERCWQCGSALWVVPPELAAHAPFTELRLTLRGPHQRHNAAIAAKTVEVLQPLFPVGREELVRGLEEAFLAGRFQIIRRPKGILVLDGAHNPSGAHALCRTLQSEFPGCRWTIIAGCLKDKDWPAIWSELQEVCESLYLVPVPSSRSAEPEALHQVVRMRSPDIPVFLMEKLETALEETQDRPYRLVTGSLYLIGHCLARLGLHPAPDPVLETDWIPTDAMRTLRCHTKPC